jgi:hypothetical protein
MASTSANLPSRAVYLGLAGLIPQLVAFAFIAIESPLRWEMEAFAFAYAGSILSFLGGIWWGVGIAMPQRPKWLFEISVAPTLIAIATMLPGIFNGIWPGPSILILGLCLSLSPLVDRRLGFGDARWQRLRLALSLALGGLTMAIGFLSLG